MVTKKRDSNKQIFKKETINEHNGVYMVCTKKNTLKLRTITAGLAIALSLSAIPVNAVEPSKWSDNAFMKAIYFDRTVKQRVLIISGVTVAISTLAYLVYKAFTRTSLEKNLIALEQLEQDVKAQYWQRIQKEEIETKPVVSAFKRLLDSYAKNSENLTAITAEEKLQLFERLLAAGNAIHNVAVTKEQLVKVCENEFFGFVKKLKEKIGEKQKAEQMKKK